MKRILDYDPVTGITDTFSYDSETDTSYYGREQDVSSILDDNKLLQNNEDYTKHGIKNEWWHYASIPLILIEKWLTEEGIDVFNKNHRTAVFRKLNDPQYRYLKATHKMHS